jgi:HAD superfamily hydrolase (TIGR01509 family)
MKALLWDVDGTLAETERDGHRVAFNQAFEAMGLPWRWDEAHYGVLLAVAGGRERLLHDMTTRSDAPALPQQREDLAAELHRRKNAFYVERVAAGAVVLRPGVHALMDACDAAGIRQAITTTTSRGNVEALLQANFGPSWARRFAVLVCGEDVQRKKPDPEVYLQALRLLEIGPLDALAVEDSPGGVAAARAAFVPVVVTQSAYFATAIVEGALAIGPGLHTREGWRPELELTEGRADAADNAGTVDQTRSRVTLADLLHWRELGDSVSQFA